MSNDIELYCLPGIDGGEQLKPPALTEHVPGNVLHQLFIWTIQIVRVVSISTSLFGFSTVMLLNVAFVRKLKESIKMKKKLPHCNTFCQDISWND